MRSARANLRFLDDLAKVATGAMGSFGEVRGQIKKMVREGLDQVMGEMDLVTRDEFERVEAIAKKARERNAELEKRIAALEGRKKKKTKGKKK